MKSFFGGVVVLLLLINSDGTPVSMAMGDENQLDPHFIRFQGKQCPVCAQFDVHWDDKLTETFPGAIARTIDCSVETYSKVCSAPGAAQMISPNYPVFAFWNGVTLDWYEGQKNIYGLEYWVQTIVGQPTDGRQVHRSFDKMYRLKRWVGDSDSSGSGTGSTVAGNFQYVQTISRMISELDIQSVVEVGCGDFVVMNNVQFGVATYHGWDVSKIAINLARQLTNNPGTHFSVSGVNQVYEGGDLLVLKDVLQHLSIQDGTRILSQLHKYKYAIITNDLNPGQPNVDRDLKTGLPLLPGGYRSLDVRQPPFDLICDQTLNLHESKIPMIPGGKKITCVVAIEPKTTSKEEL